MASCFSDQWLQSKVLAQAVERRGSAVVVTDETCDYSADGALSGAARAPQAGKIFCLGGIRHQEVPHDLLQHPDLLSIRPQLPQELEPCLRRGSVCGRSPKSRTLRVKNLGVGASSSPLGR